MSGDAPHHIIRWNVQFRGAPRQSASAVAGSRSHQRPWHSEGVAAVHTGDGSGSDQSRVVAHRGPVLSGTAVAATASAVAVWQEEGRAKEQEGSIYKRVRRCEQGAENALRGLTTGCWAPLIHTADEFASFL